MSYAFKIATLWGIDVKIHATFLLLLAWIATSHVMAGDDWGETAVGVAFVLVVFAIVVLHEFGHALTARRFGIRTRDITLLPIGGVARLERMPERPAQELLVAIAGPAVNFTLAGIFAAVLLALGEPLIPNELSAARTPFLVQLLWLNVGLGTFNLMPAFPMDGGRVLRALLAFRVSPVRATEIAAALGQALAVVFGLYGFFEHSPVILLVAVFVWIGAGNEAKVAKLRSALDAVPVEYAMIRAIATVAPEDPISVAIGHVLQGFQEDFPVTMGPHVAGILTRDALLRALAETGPDTAVASVMTRDVPTTHPAEPLDRAFAKLQASGCRSLPVVRSDGILIGLLTAHNIGELVMIQDALRRAPSARA